MRKEIESAYRLQLGDLSRAMEAAVGEILGEMRSGRAPGHDSVVLRLGGGKVIDDAVERVTTAVEALLVSHVEAGERDVGQIAESIRTNLIEKALVTMPGAGLYKSLRGNPASSEGARIEGDMKSRFSMRKNTLLRSVEDRVVRAIATHRGETLYDRWQRRAKNSPLLVVAIGVGTSFSIGWSIFQALHELYDLLHK